MRQTILLGTCLVLAAGASDSWAAPAAAEGVPAAEVLRKTDQALFPDSAALELTLTDYRPRAKPRSFRLKVKTLRGTGSVLNLISPPTEVGKSYLFKDRSIWISLPGMPNAIRVSSKEGFMDSTFANNDLMDTEYSDDYDVAIESIAESQGHKVYLLRCTAKSPQVTYHTIRMRIDHESFIPEEFEYYTRSGLLLKTCKFSERKQLAGRLRAGKIEMKDASMANNYSVITIDQMTETRFPPSSFAIEAIRK